MNATNHRWRKWKNAFMQALACGCALLVVAPLGLVFYHLLKSGIGAVNWRTMNSTLAAAIASKIRLMISSFLGITSSTSRAG